MQLGADVEQMDRLAKAFTVGQKKLRSIDVSVTQAARSTYWRGPDADTFRARWDGIARRQLSSVADVLQEISDEVKRQADQQRQASSDGSVVGAGVGPLPAHAAGIAAASPATQQEWWNSLTPAEQAEYLENAPGLLLGMDGVPDDIRVAASETYVERELADDITIWEQDYEGRIDVHVIGIIDLGVEGHAITTENADGTFTVTLSLEGEVGYRWGIENAQGGAGVEVGVEGSVAASYQFASQAEADAFLEDFRDAVIPDTGEAIGRGVFGWVPGVDDVATDAVKDGLEVLDDHSGDHHETVIHGGVYVDGDADIDLGSAGFDVDGNASAGVAHNLTTGQTSVHVDFEASAGDEAFGIGVSGDVGASAEFVLGDGGVPTELNVEFTGQVTGGVELVSALGIPNTEFGVETDSGVNISINADLTDPAVRAAAQTYAADPSTANLLALGEHADIIVTTNVITEAGGGVDLAVVEVSGGVTTTDASSVHVRPAGGVWVEPDFD
ncbi:MAG: hypothetical protein HKN26_03595 [Acidimicrobiales bacterium]|nr:hypothetical protein [Acidimicrobiales bacterium]